MICKVFVSVVLIVLMILPYLQCQDVDCHPHCTCKSSNSVTCSNVAKIPSPLPKSTRFLTLSNNFIGKILLKHEVDPLGALRLRQLYLKHNRIVAIEDRAFSSLVRLVMLDLSGNRIEAITDETFYGLRKLKYLYLNNAGIFTISSQPFLFNSNLREIDLEENKLTSVGRQFINLVNMTELLLANNKISEIVPQAFSGLRKLEQLSLFGNQLAKPSSAWFRDLLDNDGILELDSRFFSSKKEPNPWLCCPDVALYDNFVKATNKSLRSYRQLDITCSWPITLSGRLMSTLTESELHSVPCSEASTTTPILPNTEGENLKSDKSLTVAKTSNNNFLSHLSDAGLFFILVLFVLIGVIAMGFVYWYKTQKGREKLRGFVVSFNKNKSKREISASSSTKKFQQDNISYGATSPDPVKSPVRPKRPPRPSRPAPLAPKPHSRTQSYDPANSKTNPHPTYTIDVDYNSEEVWDES